ncbi:MULTISPECIES: nitrogen regulation protein NR(I) [unclassified Gilliamella]|uniref:nitrogen regulation protein NR(I) n=1 Tax=unclassified Gilliamella TaxID=2685620 RepID=UPI00226AF518|nr:MULTISPECIES: nitrogen regulation protein NR(I) [unclassified Gilliamella]MCX8575182.1 nitrogen regulation protein NR(I) [Gilliamella sp. B3831]MCX8577564.1 nitrogen regulation protein NR(I) [Gilliamella sp. B3815]MCX8590245.1 nitrogen regulation protein NR(I) [Gilliamella sp. B3812]MCX8604514.1 nitrogen regulation protein NR(I) [Gilliamella sp. B3823]MCX8606319.1 nitrogen regulation protein NR(I) [Gilliamella sp. B3825]
MNVWVVDDDSSIRWVLEKALTNAHFNCISFANGQDVIEALTNQLPKPAVLISDIKMPGIDGLSLLNYIKAQFPHLPVIIMTAHSDLDAAVNAYQKGAFDYIPKPFDVDEMIQLVERAIAQSQHLQVPNHQRTHVTAKASTGIIGEAPSMQEVFRIIGRLSKSSISVLINGESGTGKELVAKALHTHSPRSHSPFIALNMAAIPKDLIESELFGHEKGAFTGAAKIRHGRFEQANGGTLFLDEIGDMPLDVQTRLLRVLADGQFYRIGGYSPVKVDVRIIAATHQDLEARVREGKFRDDLFHRLNVIRILLPPLRDRAQDIPKLAEHFLYTTAKELGVESKVFSPEAMTVLCKFNWPGNVRQLENTCRWVTVMSSSKEILVQDLPPELLQFPMPKISVGRNDISLTLNDSQVAMDWQFLLEKWAKQSLVAGKSGILTEAVTEVERILLNCALNFTRGHKQEAANLLGWGRNTLTRKLKEFSNENDSDIH